MAVEGLNM